MKPKALADGIAVWCSHDEIGDLEKAIENPRNPNKHPEAQIKLLANIIKVQGWRNPITISKLSGFITKGAGRRKAAELMGVSKVPLDYQDYRNEAAEYADLIADNRIAELAEPDLDLVKDILESIEGLDAELTGYNLDDLGIGEEPPEDPGAQIDKAEELQHEWKTEYGQVWEIPSKATPGKTHRLMCGDSTKKDDTRRLIKENNIDLVFTDPPYGIGNTKSVKNDYGLYIDTKENLITLIAGFFPIAQDLSNRIILTPGNSNQRLYPDPTWMMAWFTPAGVGMGPWGFICWQPILCYGKDPKLQKRKGSYPDAIVHTETAEKLGHPCTKPTDFWIWLLERVSEPNEILFDPFSGSGTSTIAAERSGRICFGMEIDPKYCAVILQRCLDMGLEPKLAK